MQKYQSTDAELIAAVFQNNEKAFNVLFERYWANVYAVAYRYIKDEEMCLEIAHDIFLNIWNKRHQLTINCFKSYVITAASYHGIRKKQMLKAVPIRLIENYGYNEDESCISNRLSAVNQGEIRIGENEFDARVSLLLHDLPKRCREIYLLSRKDNLSITEISERLHISHRTVENQLTNALKHLRTALKYTVIFVLIAAVYAF